MAEPQIPFKIYVLDDSGKFSTPTDLSNLISTDDPNGIPNGLSIGTDKKLLVTPSGFELVSLATQDTEDPNENTIVLTYNDNAGVEQTLEAPAINSNVLAIVNGPNFPADPTDLRLQSTVNGVVSNELSIAQLVADINVASFAWDAESFKLTLTETSPDGGTTPGVVHELDLSGLVPVTVEGSITGDGYETPLSLVGDEAEPDPHQFYGTDAAGAKSFQNLVSTLPENVVTIDPTADTGGVFVGPSVGLPEVIPAATTTDIPLDYIGNPNVNLYAPAEFRFALDQKTGLPLIGPNGGNLVIALWEQPVAPVFDVDAYDATALAGLTVGVAFASAPPVVNGIPAPTVFAVVGTITPGLALNASTGVISGTPTTAGTFTFDVTATNVAGTDTFTVSTTVV